MVSKTSYTYDGTAKEPTVTIKGLSKDVDYTVSYANNKAVGTAFVIVEGKGNYTGQKTVTFEIVTQFTDLQAGYYYITPVMWAVENGITTGTSTTTFSPDATCTRGQVVTFLWRAMGSPKPTSTANPFTDLQAGYYYNDAVMWAVENGITTGTSSTTFGPDEPCTRGQVVTFLYRTYN